jgi:hypothetical protein
MPANYSLGGTPSPRATLKIVSSGNVYRLRHLIGYINQVTAQVAGDEAGDAVDLADVKCYRGTADQGIEGPTAPSSSGTILPGFALSESNFALAYGQDDVHYERTTMGSSTRLIAGMGARH